MVRVAEAGVQGEGSQGSERESCCKGGQEGADSLEGCGASTEHALDSGEPLMGGICGWAVILLAVIPISPLLGPATCGPERMSVIYQDLARMEALP